MAQVTGTVEKIATKPTANGPAYNIIVNGQWYGHGFQTPKFSEGQTISFTWTQNGRFQNINPKSVTIEQQQQSAPTQQQTAQSGGTGSTSGGRGYGANQLAIQYQSARNAAIHLAEVLLQNNALPLPTKKADQMDAVLAFVEDQTNQFHIKCDKVVENGGVYEEELEQRMASTDGFE